MTMNAVKGAGGLGCGSFSVVLFAVLSAEVPEKLLEVLLEVILR